jgi:ribosomal protein S18 acetylase RimI-like enzyme
MSHVSPHTLMLNYRSATPDDLPSLCALGEEVNSIHHAAWPEVFAPAGALDRDRSHWARSVGEDEAGTIVADENGTLVGFVTMSVTTESNSLFQPVRYAKVGSVGVTANHQGKGIGRKLMALAEQWAAQHGAAEVRLTVWAFNGAALRMYEELGYEMRSHALGKRLRAGAA